MLGENIRERRIKNNLTQKELAEILNVKPQTVSSWEINRTEPNMGLLQALAAALNCRKSDLIGERDEPMLDSMTSEEERLIIAYRMLSRSEQIMVLRSVGVDIKKDASESLTEVG